VIDHRPHLLMPGFIDTHIHMPQAQIIASWGAQLLDWLNTYTFPEEAKFADPAHAARIAGAFLDVLLRHGTTTAVAYCSVHPGSADAYFAAAAVRNLRMVGGKVMMDRNAPPGVLDTAQASYDDTRTLIGRWHGKGRAIYAISPRFAITSTPEQLELAGALAAEFPDLPVQTHLSENRDEIDFTLSLYPGARDYLDVYERHRLLGPRSLFGHCIHLSERERAAMAETGSVAVFCPTSNLFLGSGLYDEAGLAAAGVRRAIATDVGGGTNYSMLRTLDEGYKVLALRGQKLDPLRSFYWITLGNARALALEDRIGTLAVGSEADIVVLDAAATAAMALRAETVRTLAEELFLLQTLGDDRAVAATYVAGERFMPG
jgi:guanine deaminase